MIQVIYRWRVEPENREAFLAAWERTTTAIRETTDGARGSICVVSVDDPSTILTIAKWDRLDQWRAFVAEAKTTAMKEMHTLGTQVSHDAFEQVGDFTI